MEHFWGCRISSSDFEKYREFFPDLKSSNMFFRPWMDKDITTNVKDSNAITRSAKNDRLYDLRPSNQSEPTPSETVKNLEEFFYNERERPSRRGARRRKLSRPHRSANACDPTFRGVTVSVQVSQVSPIEKNKHWQSQLRIKSYFTVRGLKSSRALRSRHCESYEDSSSGTEDTRDSTKDDVSTTVGDSPTEGKLPTRSYLSYQRPSRLVAYNGKQCASCSTRRTPLWRDAEDGTPLCNACGIRYKKYRIRCGSCWLIPRKDGNSFTNCIRCGQEFKVSIFRRTNKQ